MWAEHILSQHNTNMSKCVDTVVLGPILCVIITSRIPQVIPNGNEMYKLLQSLVHSRKLTWIPKMMLLYGKETIAMMENFLKEKDPIVDSVDLKYTRIRLTMHTFLILIWSNLRHMRWRGILSTIRKNTKFLPPQTVWFDSTRRVSVCSCRVEGIEWFGVIHLCRKFHVIWIFRAFLPYQRCWGEALWPWSHAEASMVWER